MGQSDLVVFLAIKNIIYFHLHFASTIVCLHLQYASEITILNFNANKMRENILVTGASSGFGLLIATELHRKGYNVIGTSRNPEKCNLQYPSK